MIMLKLKVMERLILQGMLEAAFSSGNSLSQLSKMMKLNDRLDLTPEEKTELSYRKVRLLRLPDGKVVTSDEDEAFKEALGKEGVTELSAQMRWNIYKDGAADGELIDIPREVEVSDEQKEILHTLFKDRDEKKQFTKEGLAELLNIAEQLGYQLQ